MGRLNIYMPSLGEGIIEASVIKILKQVGDEVQEDDPVVEIATDKVDSEIVAPENGIIDKIAVNPGDVVKVGEVVAVIKTEALSEDYSPSVKGPEGEESFVLKKATTKDSGTEKPFSGSPKEGMQAAEDTTAKDIRESAKAKEEFTTKKAEREAEREAEGKADDLYESPIQEALDHTEVPLEKRIFLSPLVKKIIREEGLSREEVAGLKGTGYMGRITRDDILRYVRYKKEGAIHGEEVKEIPVASTLSSHERVTSEGSGIGGPRGHEESEFKKHTTPESAETKGMKSEETKRKESGEPAKTEAFARGAGGFTEVEMDRIRMLIAEHTVESKKTAPHVTSFIEVDVDSLVMIRKENKDRFMHDYGIRLTYTPLFIAATAMALEKYPGINSSLSGNKIRYYRDINIGFATALPNGNLIVPVIKNVEGLNIRGIAMRLNELAEKARSNDLAPGDIQGGTFTISNFGSYNTTAGTPIIVQPQSAILGIGEIKKRAVVVESDAGDSIAIRPIAIISLSFDHRIIDGALAGHFLGYLRECIENLTI